MIGVSFYLAIMLIAVVVAMVRAFVDGIKFKNSAFVLLGIILLCGLAFAWFVAVSFIVQM